MLFGVDIAGIIAAQMGPLLLPATLRVFTLGARTPGDLTSGPAITSTASTAARGFVESYDTKDQGAGSIVQVGDRKITLLGATLGGLVPVPSSEIDIEGDTYTVVDVQRDPAAATYLCQSRRA
jgi:hypothetical protein